MPNRNLFRLFLLMSALLLGMAGVLLQLLRISGSDAAAVGQSQGQYHLHVPLTEGTFYDRRMLPLNQSEERILAAFAPTPENIAAILPVRKGSDDLTAQIQSGAPILCTLTEAAADSDTRIILHGRADPEGALPAQHLLGYRQENTGKSGLL